MRAFLPLPPARLSALVPAAHFLLRGDLGLVVGCLALQCAALFGTRRLRARYRGLRP